MQTHADTFYAIRQQVIDYDRDNEGGLLTIGEATIVALAQMLNEDDWQDSLVYDAAFNVVGVRISGPDGVQLTIAAQ